MNRPMKCAVHLIPCLLWWTQTNSKNSFSSELECPSISPQISAAALCCKTRGALTAQLFIHNSQNNLLCSCKRRRWHFVNKTHLYLAFSSWMMRFNSSIRSTVSFLTMTSPGVSVMSRSPLFRLWTHAEWD